MYKFSAFPQITGMENFTFNSFLNILYACAGRDCACAYAPKIKTRGGVRSPDDRENAFPARSQTEEK